MQREAAPIAPNPVIMTCFGHCGIGIGAEAYRWSLIDVGADPRQPSLRGEKEQLQVLRRYGSTIMRFGASLRRGEVPLVPRALLIDLDPRAANLVLQSYPELFAMRDKHALYGLGGAARNWAEGRTRFRNEIREKYDVQERLDILSPEPVRGFTLPFSMGGGTGGAFSSAFMEYVKGRGPGLEVMATFGILPEFGYDPVIYGPAHISIIMNLAYQIRFSDCPILMDNKSLRFYAQHFRDELSKRSSIVDELPKELEIAWREYRNMNLLSAHLIAFFASSFTRETEWDMANYRTWLASSKPRFVVPWVIPLVPHGGSEMNSVENALREHSDGVLFDLGEDLKRKPGEKDSVCALIKVRGKFEREDRELMKKIITDRFPMEEKRIIFIRIPCMEREAAGACILVNTRAVSDRILPIVKEAEETWDGYKSEYEKWGLKEEEFKKAVIEVVGHFS